MIYLNLIQFDSINQIDFYFKNPIDAKIGDGRYPRGV